MPDKTATRPGVGNNRASMMAHIAAAREEQIDKEMKEGGTAEGISVLEPGESKTVAVVKPEGVDQAEWDKLDDEAKAGLAEAEAERIRVEAEAAAGGGESSEAKAEREKKEAEAKAAEEARAKATAGTGGRKVKIKVDGVEQEIDESVALAAGIKTLQKESAADKRLEEASRLFKEATAAIETARAGKVQEQNQGGASLPDKGGAAVAVLTDEAFTEAVKKIQYGSEAEAAATLKDLITKAAAQGQSEQLTLDRVAEMLDFREATQWAHGEYKEIFGDPKLRTLFGSEEKRLRAAGDMRPYREIYKDIGDGLNQWRKEHGSSPAPKVETEKNVIQQRQERKASVVTIPTAAARQPGAPQTKEPTPSDIVDSMRKARRQA